MKIALHPHAEARLAERGATQDEVRATVEGGWLVITVLVRFF